MDMNTTRTTTKLPMPAKQEDKRLAVTAALVSLGLHPHDRVRETLADMCATAADVIDMCAVMRDASPGNRVAAALRMLKARRGS
jgi:hypothetical protein